MRSQRKVRENVAAVQADRPPEDVAILCNPRAGGRWRVLADILDSEEAHGVRRIVTDDLEDIREAIAGIGRRARLLCIYGGDGTIFRVIQELLRDPAARQPRLALLGGGTMNVTATWCGLRGTPGENFRQVMRAYRADRLLWREVPLVAVTQKGQTRHGFTFGLGPLVRVLERFESGHKSRAAALGVGARAAAAALVGLPRAARATLRPLEAEITVDGARLPRERFTAVFANVTGTLNPFVVPFTADRTRASFHFLAYAVSPRELAVRAPLLLRGVVPSEPRYLNRPASHVVIATDEPRFTIDGEILSSSDRVFELRLGPALELATLEAPRSASARARVLWRRVTSRAGRR